MTPPDRHWALNRHIPDDDPAISVSAYQLPVLPDETQGVDGGSVASEDIEGLCRWSFHRWT